MSTFIKNLLQKPTYGWETETGALAIPTNNMMWKEVFLRINIFRDKKNWISFISVLKISVLMVFLGFFLFGYFNPYYLLAIVFYSMVVMGTHGTIWYHRYCTHKSYQFSHPIWRFITQNLVIKTIPEETYVISHHVHHSLSDQPGDPYNPEAGLLYCMVAEFNHQRISTELDEKEYAKAAHFMKDTGIKVNSFRQYQKWGSVSHPLSMVVLWIVNWTFWFAVLNWIGGPSLALAIFSAALVWFIGVRAFNYSGHGGGKAKHREGVDFDRSNLSINQNRPGLLAGEWHNNHHLYPGSARAGFLPGQYDLAFIYVFLLKKMGMVTSYRDAKDVFLRKYVEKGHSRDMKPLEGEAYSREHLQIINEEFGNKQLDKTMLP